MFGCFVYTLLSFSLFLITSTEKDDDYIVLCHHWDCWVLLSLQLLLIKALRQVKPLHWQSALQYIFCFWNLNVEIIVCCVCVVFPAKRISPKQILEVLPRFLPWLLFKYILKLITWKKNKNKNLSILGPVHSPLYLSCEFILLLYEVFKNML